MKLRATNSGTIAVKIDLVGIYKFICILVVLDGLSCGYQVDAAAAAAQQRGGVLTGPTDLSVELAERLVSLRPGADWALMAKNGTDVTSLARTVARATTGKRFILREHAQPSSSSSSPSSSSSSSSPPAAAAYHGASNVWARGSPGVLDPEGAAFEAGYTYNDLASVEAALTQGQAAGDVAAIFVGGCSYMYSKPTVEPTPEFAKGLRALADKHGCLLVVDEIRTNFRVGQSLQGHWADLVAGKGLLLFRSKNLPAYHISLLFTLQFP
jgi:glutamate-1-semialdehyde 2,1-aminomutase